MMYIYMYIYAYVYQHICRTTRATRCDQYCSFSIRAEMALLTSKQKNKKTKQIGTCCYWIVYGIREIHAVTFFQHRV